MVDGAALKIVGTPWNRTTGGAIHLVVEKDRHGQLPARMGEIAATITGTYDDHGAFGHEITAPKANQDTASAALPLRQRIHDALAGLGDIGATSGTALAAAVKGRKQDILNEAEAMAEEGLVIIREYGRGYRYTLNTNHTETP